MADKDYTIKTTITADAGQATQELQKFDSSLGGIGDNVKMSLSGLQGLATIASGVAAGFAIVTSVINKVGDAMNKMVGNTVAYADEVRDLSRTTGTSVEETSRLIQAADDAFVSFETLRLATKNLINQGIQPSIENMARLSDEYLSIQDPVLRSQYLMEKFGRAGLEMGKFLEMGGEGIKVAASEADKFGLVLSGENVENAKKYKQAMDGLNDSLDGLKYKLGNQVLPVLTSVINSLNQLAQTQIFPEKDDTLVLVENSAQNVTDELVGMFYAIRNTDNVMRESASIASAYAYQMMQVDATMRTGTRTQSDYNIALYDSRNAVEETASVTEAYNYQMMQIDSITASAIETTRDMTREQEIAAEANKLATQDWRRLSDSIDSYWSAVDELGNAEASFMAEMGGKLIGAFDKFWMTAKSETKGKKLVDLVLGTDYAAQEAMQKDIDNFVKTFRNSFDSPEAKAALEALKNKWMPLDEDVKKATEKVDTIQMAIDNMHGARVPIEIYVTYPNGQIPDLTGYTLPTVHLPSTPSPAPVEPPGSYARGGDFIVPPQYINDGYLMRVSAGEHVTVTPADQMRGKGGDNFTYNIYNPTTMAMAQATTRAARLARYNSAMGQ